MWGWRGCGTPHAAPVCPRRPHATTFWPLPASRLLHRADKNYEEAIKCYKQALRLDPDGQQSVRRSGRA